jgi:ABC-type sugar transport system substrate-binding protein
VPVIGVNMALPVIAAAEGDAYAEVMQPLSLALADRCDAILRLPGDSAGADEELARFEAAGKPVFRSLAEVPPRR